MKILLPLFVLLILFSTSCRNTSDSSSSGNEIIVEIPEDFVRFYERFHTDSSYQMDHIVFPLDQRNDTTKWTREEWVMHMPFDRQSGNFTRQLDNFEGIITETIRDKNGTFIIHRRFAEIDDAYHLIYYTIENRMEGWSENLQ